MQIAESVITNLFKEIMTRCKAERKAKSGASLRALAKSLGKTENFVGAFENGRNFPSIKTFLAYLMINKFDVAPLRSLSISTQTAYTPLPEKHARLLALIPGFTDDQLDLALKVGELDEMQVGFLLEQARIAQLIRFKTIDRDRR